MNPRPRPLATVFAPAGVVISCGNVELRWLADDDLPALIDVALDGVHDDGRPMPFMSPWTLAPRDEIPANTARFFWHMRAACVPDDWNLSFGTFVDGQIAGMQELKGKNFSKLRRAESGSWLGRRFQGRGVGTLMRQMVVALAFDHLGAIECRSGAFVDNQRSLGVSRRVGYQILDTCRDLRVDEQGWAEHHMLKVTPETFVRPDREISYQGVDEFKAFAGL